MPSGFSAQHFARGAPINDSNASTSTTYSSSKIDQKIASSSATFLALTDTPASFSAGETLRVNAAGNALEYYTPAGGVTIDDASVSAASVYSSNKIDTTYVQQSRVKNAASTTAGDVYDVRHVDAQLATKANTSHTHVINDVTNLQTSLDAKLETSKVKNAASTTAGDVYDVRYVNTELAGKANTSHTHVIGDVTNLQTSLDAKLETSKVKNAASTTAGDVYDVRYVNAQLATKASGSHTHVIGDVTNLQTSLDAKLETSKVKNANSTTAGDVYDVRHVNTQLATKPEIDDSIYRTNLVWSSSKIYNELATKATIDDSIYRTYLVWSSTKTRNTIYGLIDDSTTRTTNVWSSTKTNNQIQTAVANLVASAPTTLDTLNELAAALGDDPNFATTVTNSIATKLPLAGGAMTGHITTNQTVFSNNNELVTKQYVDTRLPTDVNTPISYTIQNAVTDQNYVFGIAGAANAMALVEIPKIYTGVPASSRGVRVGFNDAGDYGSGMIAIGYEALADSTGSAGQSNAVRSVAVGYQAGYHAQAANHGIYIGPYQGYQLSTHNQLRIGNSGVSPTTTGYDKAIIEGTMATTDAGQTLRLNADTIYLGSSLPTSQPADNRLWLSNGSLSIGAVSGGGGSTYLSLTDTPASHTANALLYSTGSAIAHTTSEILIDGNGVEVNQLNARVNNTSNIGDSSHRFNTVHCLAVQSTSGKLILPTSAGTVGQVLSIASLNGSDMTLGFSTASGGSGSATNVDPLTFGQSGGANTTVNGVTQSPDLHRTGITIGDRRFKWFVDDSFFAKSSLSKELANGVLNGYLRVYGLSSNPVGPGNYAYTGTADNETVFEENVLEGGHITFTPNNGVHYKFRGIRLNADSYATDFTQMSPAGTGLYNSCVANGADCRLAAFGLKDGVWKWLGTVSLNNTNAPSSGTIANPKDDTSMAEDPLTPSTTMRSEQMDFGSVKAPAIGITGSGSAQEVNGSIGAIGMLNWGTSNVKWPGFQPTPLLGVRRGQGTVYSGTYLWKFTHNIDFYQSYRIQHVKSGLTTTVNSVQYQRFNDNRQGQNGMTEVEFWAGVGT